MYWPFVAASTLFVGLTLWASANALAAGRKTLAGALAAGSGVVATGYLFHNLFFFWQDGVRFLFWAPLLIDLLIVQAIFIVSWRRALGIIAFASLVSACLGCSLRVLVG